MKKIIITSVTLCFIVMVATALSEKSASEQAAKDRVEAQGKRLEQDTRLDDDLQQRKQEQATEKHREKLGVEERLARQREDFEQNLYGRAGSVFPGAPFYYSQKEQTTLQVEDPNLLKILTSIHFTNQQNLHRISVLEGKVKLLEERLKKLEANEKRYFYQRKRLEKQLNSLQEW